MSLFTRTILLLALVFACLGESHAQGQKKINSADVYLRGYLIMEEGMKLLQKEDYAGAYYKLKDSKEIFDSVFQSDPSWNPEIVDYRRKRVNELMETAKQSEIQRRQRAAANPDTIRPTPPPTKDQPKSALPMLPSPPPNTAKLEAPAQPRTADVVLQTKLADYQERIKQLELKNDGILKEIGSKDQQLSKLGAQLVDSQSEQKRLLDRLTEANTKLDIASLGKKKEDATLLKTIDNLKKEQARLQGELEKAVGLLKDANEKNASLISDVREAYATIKSLNDEKAKLVAERDQFSQLLQGDASKTDKLKTLAAENTKLRKTMEELQDRLGKLQKERETEKKDVATAKEEMAKQREADQKLIADLRGQLDVARTELSRIKAENAEYQNQMAALSDRLDATERALAQSANPAMTESEALKENDLLHEIIVKMIKQQAGREKAKKQALAELEATGQMSEQLLGSIREMSEPYQMTPAERALLQAAGAPKLADDGTGINATMISPDVIPGDTTQTEPPKLDGPPPSPDELAAYSTAAQRQFNSQRFEEAESNYDKILRLDPLNFGARCNMAVSQVRQGKLDAAITNLKKVLAYNYDNDFPHYLLGTIYLRQSKISDATDSINTALKIKGDNGDGHFALGLIQLKQKRFKEAEKEFLLTVQYDPQNADAHYNLAILYATMEDSKKDSARSHYRKAIELGAKPDNNLDRLLRS